MLKCPNPKCESENVTEVPRSGRTSGNSWIVSYVCHDCGERFNKGEEIKHKGN